MIIGITGKAGSGKDTAAAFLVNQFHFVRIGLADPVKRVCQELFYFSDEQLWGPSECRNKEDRRYLRMKAGALGTMIVGWSGEGPSIGATTEPNPKEDVYLSPRHALQQLGTEFGRRCFEDVWVMHCLDAYEELKGNSDLMYTPKEGVISRTEITCQGEWKRDDAPREPYAGVVVPDIRFWNEAEAIRKAGGKIWRINRPHAGLKGAEAYHLSETSMDDIEPDHVLNNDGTIEDLNREVLIACRAAGIRGKIQLLVQPDEQVQLPESKQLLELLDRRQADVDAGKLLPYDPTQVDVPPFKRRR